MKICLIVIQSMCYPETKNKRTCTVLQAGRIALGRSLQAAGQGFRAEDLRNVPLAYSDFQV